MIAITTSNSIKVKPRLGSARKAALKRNALQTLRDFVGADLTEFKTDHFDPTTR
ncbi:MAG: hypothetical protein M5U12_03465 [Verrucomicrobia bacterium]|nr:hypothetical protein [Verrucomicrobiota bacterium]